MRNEKVVTVRREDYRPPEFLVDRIELTFDLDPVSTTVEARLDVRRNPAVTAGPLVLDGENLQLLGVEIDDRPITNFELADGRLTLPLAPATTRARVRVRNTVAPDLEPRFDGGRNRVEVERQLDLVDQKRGWTIVFAPDGDDLFVAHAGSENETGAAAARRRQEGQL